MGLGLGLGLGLVLGQGLGYDERLDHVDQTVSLLLHADQCTLNHLNSLLAVSVMISTMQHKYTAIPLDHLKW